MDPRSAAMIDLCEPIWFTHIHRSIVQLSRNCRQCTERGKNLRPFLGKTHSLQIESTVEPNEEVQLDFAGLLPNELNHRSVYTRSHRLLVEFPTAKVVFNNRAATRFMQRYKSINSVSQNSDAIRVKSSVFFCGSSNIK